MKTMKTILLCRPELKLRRRLGLGSARVSRAVFGVAPKTLSDKILPPGKKSNGLTRVWARRPNPHAGRVRSRLRLLALNALFALISLGGNGFAQTNGTVSGAADYTKFSAFVTDRNIFDPNRVPHSSSPNRPRQAQRQRPRSVSSPTIALVGTMAYEKGDFAFFSSNDAEQKRILPVSEKIVGYTVTAISRTGVTLTDTNKNELAMKIGDVLRQDNGGWHLDGAGDVPAGAATDSTSTASSSSSESMASPSLEGNDALKRLMEKRKRAQEEK